MPEVIYMKKPDGGRLGMTAHDDPEAVVYRRIDPDTVTVKRGDVDAIKGKLEFMKNGCLVPPDGGAPEISDYIHTATETLEILDRALKGE